MHHELSILALIRGRERFVYVFDDASREELVAAIRAQAADPGLSLSWYDAAVLTDRVRRPGQEAGTPTTG